MSYDPWGRGLAPLGFQYGTFQLAGTYAIGADGAGTVSIDFQNGAIQQTDVFRVEPGDAAMTRFWLISTCPTQRGKVVPELVSGEAVRLSKTRVLSCSRMAAASLKSGESSILPIRPSIDSTVSRAPPRPARSRLCELIAARGLVQALSSSSEYQCPPHVRFRAVIVSDQGAQLSRSETAPTEKSAPPD